MFALHGRAGAAQLSSRSNRTSERRAAGVGNISRVALVLAASTAAGEALAVSNPPAVTKVNDQFFSWFVTDSDRYLTSPFLSDQNAGSVNAWLDSLPSNQPLAVKIERPISNSTANLIFNNPSYHVSYVLGDLEGGNTLNNLKKLTDQVRFINANPVSGKTYSNNAFIGNFGFQPLDNDPTNPLNYRKNSQNSHSFAGFGKGEYNSTKLNMAMVELYPGSGSYRNPAAGNSDAPNIRSALFTLPVQRLSLTKIELPKGHALVPYVTNFNNWGVTALDTDRNPANGYRFVPGQAMAAKNGLPAVSAADTTNQMLSRRDTAAQAAHYRMRGADSYVQFVSGVIGVSEETLRKDLRTGWLQSDVDSVFNSSDHKLLLGKDTDYPGSGNTGDKDPNGNIIVDGKEKSIEAAGALFSGVYSLSLKKMEVLLTNMDEEDHDLTLPPKIAGFDLKARTFDVDPGVHLLVEYRLTNSGPNKGWSVWQQSTPFNVLPNDRSQIGVPEPTTIWFAAAAAACTIGRRRPREHKKADDATVNGPMGLCAGNLPDDVFVSA